jgi:rod shape-determining protein MreC
VPRHRSVRLATTGATAQRTASSTFGSRSTGTLGRRVVVVALVLVSLVLATAYFREAESGPLHSAQGTAAGVLEPFQIGAERVVRPFRDAWGWFDDLRNARSENKRLKKQVAALQKRAAFAPASGPAALGGVKRYSHAPSYVHGDYTLLKADVIADLPSYQQQVVVSAGRGDHVRRYDPVVSSTEPGQLLGHVSKVGPNTSLVTLISDRSSAVAIVDVAHDTKGILRGSGPDAGSLAMDQVSKQDVVAARDIVTTAGRLSGGSFYPMGIPVGTIDAVSQSDTDPFKLVSISPFADLGAIDQVVILLRKGPVPSLP